ncbi:hypothetical protein [Desulfallas thermosapovorans]|uniref:Uncharacterized protein n=1 Tax=Desulfallas thermosapovorans DSM 6562 TaxID=1121431 RepID=A0A5S4ZTE0_9FIRM|nr:hypothetical protein [Desulfallas thermosapovorans]TYO95950.1 hypothetical protein LX24_01340 [Desulfallas thermosapovorans DSM 6562]
MSSISQTSNHGFELGIANVMQHLLKSLEGFFSAPNITKKARIWHGNFSYPLIPNTSIRNFYNMPPVTSIDTGDCYICVFEAIGYQGNYRIIGPGEKVQLNDCSSLVVSSQKFSVASIRHNAKPPAGYWEMDGPTYLARFSSGYRYA